MPNPNDQIPAGGTGRTAEQIEAELSSIDNAAREQMLADANPPADGKPAVKTGEPDYEYEAARKGWKPEAQYTGPEGKWVDAKTFVERGERFTKKLEGEIDTLKKQVQAFEGTKAQFRKFFDDQMAKRDKEHTEAIQALRIQRSQATRDGDDELAIELEDRIEATRKQQQALKTEATEAATERTEGASVAAGNEPNPVLDEFIADGNQWFKDDEALAKHAIAVGKQMRANGEKAIGRKFLEMVKEQVRDDFPRRFKEIDAANGTQQRQSTTGGAGNGGNGSGNQGYQGKTERDLPPEDLQVMRQFIKDGLYTKETFLKSYFSRNA
jgi:hypothetical protein